MKIRFKRVLVALALPMILTASPLTLARGAEHPQIHPGDFHLEGGPVSPFHRVGIMPSPHNPNPRYPERLP